MTIVDKYQNILPIFSVEESAVVFNVGRISFFIKHILFTQSIESEANLSSSMGGGFGFISGGSRWGRRGRLHAPPPQRERERERERERVPEIFFAVN